MAHFAQLDENNIVIEVVVVDNDMILVDNVESEAKGIEFLKSILGQDTRWVQTSYNGNFRKRYAGIGYEYSETYDAFIHPYKWPSWIFNETTCAWEAPIPYPNDGKSYYWDEYDLRWVEEGKKT